MLALLAAACDTVIPYPKTGEDEMLYISGLATEGESSFSVRKLFPITEKSFVTLKKMTMLDAAMELIVNGEAIPLAYSNDSLECIFTTDYEFTSGDRITVKVSTAGMPEAICETIMPDWPEVISMSCDRVDGKTVDFNAAIQTEPDKMDGYVYSLNIERLTEYYIDGKKVSETIDTISQSLHSGDRTKTIYYKNRPVTGYEAASQSGIHSLSKTIILTDLPETTDDDGHTVRAESTIRRVRLCALHLSEPLYLSLKTSRIRVDYDSESEISFVAPLEYSNINGVKGTIGCATAYQSEWMGL